MYIDYNENPTVQEGLAEAQIKNLRTAQAKINEIKSMIDQAATAGTNARGEAGTAINDMCNSTKSELDGVIRKLNDLAAYMQTTLSNYEELDRKARAAIAAKASSASGSGIGGAGMSF